MRRLSRLGAARRGKENGGHAARRFRQATGISRDNRRMNDLGEFELIERYFRHPTPHALVGPG
ncbi:MAG: hypothetical protein EPO12_13345, partial [Aquabacterium sp.]